MKNNIDIPKTVLNAFPALLSASFIRQLASPVPIVPDTIFNIYTTKSQDFLALVATDYADPYDQKLELKNISGSYGFEFKDLIKPHSVNDETISVLQHNEMDDDFFVTSPHKNHQIYYYLANLKQNN